MGLLAGIGTGLNCFTGNGSVNCDSIGDTKNESVYFTAVYIRYNEVLSEKEKSENLEQFENCTGNYDKNMNDEIDKVIFYKNGELLGYSYYGHDSYEKGLEFWNDSECPFFIGLTPVNRENFLCGLNGYIYSTRLYTTSLTPDEVKDNYDMTLKYRSSF